MQMAVSLQQSMSCSKKEKLLSPCYAIQTLDTGERIKREIRIFFPHPDADIGVGMLRGQLYRDCKEHLLVSLAISLTPPNIGNKISTYVLSKIRNYYRG